MEKYVKGIEKFREYNPVTSHPEVQVKGEVTQVHGSPWLGHRIHNT